MPFQDIRKEKEKAISNGTMVGERSCFLQHKAIKNLCIIKERKKESTVDDEYAQFFSDNNSKGDV